MKICPACSREYPAERTHCERDGVMLVALTTGATGKAEDLVGRTIDGRYLIEGIVGRGGMGTVYACRHVVVGKTFAMKVVRPGTEQTSDVLQRFIREAQTANSIKSRHIVEMTDFGQMPSGQFYMTMELLEGMDLGKGLKRGLTNQQLLHIFIQCAEVLELTHQRGVVHRDLKPDNIFLVREDDDPLFVKLLDFGIAKALHAGPSGLTETGVVLGTPYYMSPEQARGGEVDHRTDIYSLGVIMYRAFAGKLPFVADSAVGVLTRHLTESPELPSRVGGVPPDIERVILTCLEKHPDRRYPTMAGLAAALRAILSGQGVAGPRPPTAQGTQSYADLVASQHPGLAASQRATAVNPSPYAPPPALSASQQSAAVQSPYAPPPPPGASQANAAIAGTAARPASLVGSQASPVSAAYAQAASGAHPQVAPQAQGNAYPQAAASGAHPQAQYAQAALSGAHPQAQSGAYAQAAASGALPQVAPQAQSGAYAQAAPQAQSGAYAQAAPQAQSGAHPQAYAQAAPSGAHPQAALSGPYPQAALSGAHPQAALSGPHPQAAPIAASSMSGAPPGALGAEWTAAHGLAASQAMRTQQPRRKWPILVGALGMLGLGAIIAFTLARTPASDAGPIGAAGQTSASAAHEAPSTSAAPSSAPNDAPSASPSASASTGAAATPTSAAGASAKPNSATPKPTASAKATATASASTTTTKRPEIRSPFD